ncbi:MAG: CesT family type III secretion system chaperone [Puniceicoccales bacterium]|jgi:hypothetical protein|nr:CesT family type III secretion system chaperone [Puniceicoccales bacterium]
MEWGDAIGVLSEFFRVEDWETEIGGVYEIVLDKAIELKVYKAGSSTIVFNGIAGVTIDNNKQSESVLKKILQWNFGRIKDNNDTLSIDVPQRRLMITRKLELRDMDDYGIILEAESFVANLSFWSDATIGNPPPMVGQSMQLLNFLR